MSLKYRGLFGALVLLCVFAGYVVGGDVDPREDKSPWGMCSGGEWRSEYPRFNPLISKAGIRWLRIFPSWLSIEREEGKFDWTEADRTVADAKKNNIKIGGMFVFFPKWASADGKNPRANPVKDIKYWKRFVKAAVERYKDDIKYWEVWNEFNGGFAKSSNKPKDYAGLVVGTYEAVKEADPTAMVGMSCANFDLSFFTKAIKAGAGGHFDYICVHPYELLGLVARSNGEPAYLSMATSIRKMLADNKQKTDMPLWITEIGYKAPVNPNAEKDAKQAQMLVKAYVMAIAQGFAKIEWFEIRGPQYGKGTDHGIIRKDWSLRPAYHALMLMTQTLGIEPEYAGWYRFGKDGYGFLYKNAGKDILVAWASFGKTVQVKFDTDVTLTGIDGKSTPLAANQTGTLDNSPVFITGLPKKLVGEAVANKNKKFPWGGDYSKTDTVNCIMGSAAESGLVNNNPDGVTIVNALDHTYALTVSRRKGKFFGKRSRQINFKAHHTFTADNPDQYEITLVARRANQKKKSVAWIYFYESDNGYKPVKGRWEIPAGDEWHEHTWKVDKANFVGQWGYNFCFGTGGEPFYIKEVRLRRITPAVQQK